MRIGFALEYSLGHTTHALNLKRVLESGEFPEIVPHYVDLPYDGTPVGSWARLPPVRSNWSVRASLGAYLGLRSQARSLDAALFHTQITSLFSAGFMRRVPSVISLDATPLQIDALGAAYNHTPSGSGRIEGLKKRLNERAFGAARHLVTWSEWTKTSLVEDYGVTADKITVIPPGVDTDLWSFPSREKTLGAPVELLFVGADFNRKGGDTLVAAYRRLPESIRKQARLRLVTRSPIEGLVGPKSDGDAGISVYNNLTANSPELRALYASADIFVFPTRGDCLPLAVLEALSSGLPVIATAVGALPEAVREGETGQIVPVDDVEALCAAIERLAADPVKRLRLGQNARVSAVARFDAATNYRRLVELVMGQARC